MIEPIPTDDLDPGALVFGDWLERVLDGLNSAGIDLVANDHYTIAADPGRPRELAPAANRTRGLAEGAPWLLRKHSTSAVNGQPRSRARARGEMMRDTVSHIAREAVPLGAAVRSIAPAVLMHSIGGSSYLFCINHNEHPATVQSVGIGLIRGARSDGGLRNPAGGVAVIDEHGHHSEEPRQ